ncbi:TfoX/Sxy family protein [Chamaesiphon polymorphus]|uniref:Competence protein TfoX n=1 Tax=Chamaesiphon polymorphus CCALA 037 TaxID=2107692 RepID=A0A2T1GM49_9CYAN|nr:TfoX/Sxy family protein [Chamaesiphon polymorphus]PSB58972.1 competence protein TfoX [Chamaesiphon polymorphus CCALA 037]
MASDLNFVEYICDLMDGAGEVSFKKMFGEYAIYCQNKVVALICDNQLFVKPTAGGRSTIANVIEAPPYPGAKPYFLIEEQLDNREWLSALIQLTASELPTPKPKKPKQVKKSPLK